MKRILILGMALMMLAAVSISAQKTPRCSCGTRTPPRGWSTDVAIWQKFKDTNPDIDLQQEILFSDAYHNKLSAYIAAGNIPDVFYLWPSRGRARRSSTTRSWRRT